MGHDRMIDHISLSVSDIARSRAFYDRVLATLGQSRAMDENDHPDYVASGYGPGAIEPAFWIGADAQTPRPPNPPVGQHIAFSAPDRAAVDAFYREALAAGATGNGEPGLRPHYHPDYYAAFVIDPDGYHLEAVCHLSG